MRFPLRYLLLAPLLLAIRPALACATAPRLDEHVQVADESAIIVWDEQTHTEHFIRTATFDPNGLKSHDFGFLVPTPSRPQLAQASDTAFLHLERLMEPEHRTEVLTGIDWTPRFSSGVETNAITAPPPLATDASPSVHVLGTQRVAGYDAVILQADDVTALTNWLKKHGYASRPALSEWFKPYIAAKWTITAFKIAGDAQQRLQTSTVRMTFHTPRPFFPYREPADQREAQSGAGQQPRLLRVFLLGTRRMDGTIGRNRNFVWPGSTAWTDRVNEGERASLASEVALAPGQLPAALWMTVFQDNSMPRPGVDDLFFSPSPNQERIVPEPIVTTVDKRTHLPEDVMILAAIGAVVLGAWAMPSVEKWATNRLRKT